MSCPIRCYAPLPSLSNLIHTCTFLNVVPQGASRLYGIKCIYCVLYATVQSGHMCVIKEARYRLRTVIQVQAACVSESY